MAEYVHEGVSFRIIGDHPHKGELCHPVGDTEDTVTQKDMFGTKMFLMSLVNCPHKVDKAYVEKKNLMLLKP